MVDHFESAKRTVARANHHISDLERQILAFTNEKPWSYIVDEDADGFHKLHKIRFSRRLPIDLPSIVFDAVNNLRASLDHCGYACAVAAKSDSLKHIAFPFAKDEARWAAKVAGCCKDLPKEIIAFFRSCNAYKGGNEILWSMNELCNTKKHFSLVPLTAGKASLKITPTEKHELAIKHRASGGFTISGGGSPAGFHGFIMSEVSSANSRWNAAKNELLLLKTDPKENVQYDANVALSVSIEGIETLRGIPAVSALQQMLKVVATVGATTEGECRRLRLI